MKIQPPVFCHTYSLIKLQQYFVETACGLVEPELWLVLVLLVPVLSSSSRYYGARATYNPSNGKRSPSAYDEVAVRYPNGVSTVIHHSNFRASSIARNKADDLCKKALRAAVEVSLFCGPDWELGLYKRILSEDCGIEVDVGSSKNGSSENDSRSAQD